MFTETIKNRPSPPVTTPGSMVFLSSVTASSSATVDLEETFDSTFDAYVIEAVDITTSVDSATIQCQLKVGGAFDTGANYAFHRAAPGSNSTAYSASVAAAATALDIGRNMGSAANESFHFTMHVKGPTSTVFKKKLYWSGIHLTTIGIVNTITGAGLNESTSALTGVRFFSSNAGDIVSGTFRLYGIKNA